MSQNEITGKVKELRELRRMAEEISAEITAIEDTIKQHMTITNADTLAGDDWKITWKPIASSRFDSKAFKVAQPELYQSFTKTTEALRFTVA